MSGAHSADADPVAHKQDLQREQNVLFVGLSQHVHRLEDQNRLAGTVPCVAQPVS
jgi:hypothetical protein